MSDNEQFTIHRLVGTQVNSTSPIEVEFWIRNDTTDVMNDGHMVIKFGGEVVRDPWAVVRRVDKDPSMTQRANSYISHEPLTLSEMRWAWNALMEETNPGGRSSWVYVSKGEHTPLPA
jgi:hypothetical protein